ncbi:HEAT repeat domain-containing protein [Pontibacter burrus]|uniref:HEAT repeat domain-containing protein n=1 Tax=Pontibacter burrus TaxID=2704466 RepID=A0A6B3LND9_9BACT|nr:HEAT repeat domain-containing protein [Pontibacter burrus]NEM98422.1 HEAT repeat domain-containing protein [Pontibacter burrus]
MTSILSTALQQLARFTSIELFFIAISVLATIIITLIGAMLYIMLAKKNISNREAQLQQQFKYWLVSIILQDADKQQRFEIPEDIKPLVHRRFARKALLAELIRLKNDLSGQSGDNLIKLYNELQLDRLSAYDMRNGRWFEKAKGIQELAVMEQKAYIDEIYPLANHRHPMVRMEAQIALVYLLQYEGLSFFENLKYPLTEWHQIKLLQLLANQPISSETIVTSWLNSPNPSVVQFTLKLIAEQHATQFQNDVISCLSHPDDAVRRQAIACLGEIPSEPAATALRTHYTNESCKVLQLTILSGLMKTGTAGELPFLQELQLAPDESVRLAAMKTMQHLQQQA